MVEERDSSEVDVFKEVTAEPLMPLASTCSARLTNTGPSGRDEDRGLGRLTVVTSYAHGARATTVVFVGGRGTTFFLLGR